MRPNTMFFDILSSQNTANTCVFGWCALEAGSHASEENNGIYDTF